MPQMIPVIASAVSWVSSAAAAASASLVGWMATPFVAAMGEGAAIAMAQGVLKMTATALGSYALNAVLAPKVGSAGSPVSFKADPSSPIRGVMGYFGTGGTQAHMRVWGKNNLMISYMVILSLGPIEGVQKFEANSTQVNFTGPNGLAAPVEPYKDKMWMTYKNGLPTDGALMPPPVGGVPAMEWTGNHKTSGYAGAFWTMQNNSKRASYEGGVPKPIWTLKGQKLYDPRKDSTQTAIGGSGSHRANDWSTWEYTENPQIHAINWLMGHHKKLTGGFIDRNFLLAGVGANITSVHLQSLVAGANVSDANGWKICGEWNSQDDKWQVFAAMLQAGGSVPTHVGAQIGCMTNAPRVPVGTITEADIIGNINIKVMASSRDRFNTIYPRYLSEPNGWEYATAGAVSAAEYVTQDGGEERSKEITYSYVGSSKQVGELAAYDLANTRETMKLAFPAKPYLIGVRAGDAVNVHLPSRGIVNRKFIVMARPIEIDEGGISFELRSETDEKHPWALGQTDRPAPSPSLDPFSPVPVAPDPSEWVVTPRPPVDGSQQPIFDLDGEVPDGIGSVLVEVAGSIAGPWRQVYEGPPTSGSIPITGLDPLQNYYVGVTYLSVKGMPSDRTVYGPYTAPDFIATDVTHIGGREVGDFAHLPEEMATVREEVDDMRIEVDEQRTDLSSLADGLINTGLQIAQEAETRETDDELLATTVGLIGAKNAAGTAFIIDRDKVMVTPTESFGQRDSLIEARFGGTASSYLLTKAEAAATDAEAAVSALTAMGVDLDDASSWAVDSTQIRVTPSETLATRLNSIGVQMGNRLTGTQVDARVDTKIAAEIAAGGAISSWANSVYTSQDDFNSTSGILLGSINGLEARASLFVDANGRIGGVNVGVDQDTIDMEFVSNRFFFVDPASGQKTQVLTYVGGQWTFDSNVRITGDLLVAGTIRNTQIQNNTITGLTATYQAAQITLNGSTPMEIVDVWIGVEKPNSPVVIDFNAWVNLRHDASGSFQTTVEIRRTSDASSGTQIVMQTLEGSGMANDTFAGAVPLKAIDRPGVGFWRYLVRIWSNNDVMSVQTCKARYINATEYKTNV